MPEQGRIDLVHRFFKGTAATYDSIVRLCTLGFDQRWKKRLLDKIPAGSTRIMDQACGTGILTFRIARAFPHCQVTGVDVTNEYLEVARKKAIDLRLDNVEFILGRAEDVLLDQSLDCITSCYLAKYAELERLVKNIGTMLRDGGILIMQDFTYPSNRAFALMWELYFKLLQTVGTRRYPKWKAIFEDLPGLIRETEWTADVVRILRENGFSSITVETFTLGTCTIVTARKDQMQFSR